MSLPASPLMIELGAYWAHYSIWLKKERPKASVIMVEPDPGNLATGRANFSRNGYDGEFIQGVVAKGQWMLDPFLKFRCTGLRPEVPKRLCAAAPDHLNAEIWRSGIVPGTVVAR
jgi:hypothetical protein